MIGEAGAMQISGANLLVAAGQTRAANAPRGQNAAFAAALKGAETQSAKFAPQSFDEPEAGPEAGEASEAVPASAAPAKPAAGASGIPAPGSTLDIRV